MKISTVRSRWAAIGAAVAVSLGAGGIGISHATISSGERAVFVPLDDPCRLASTRPAPDTVGPRTAGIGPDESYTLDGWGTEGNCTLPSNTAGLALNVTAVNASQQTNLRFFPADAAVPGTANLNPSPGAPPTPNAVNVNLDSSGQFKVFNKFGIVEVVIDVMGYYEDHNHDDRYVPQGDIVITHGPAAFGNPADTVQVFGDAMRNASGNGFANMPLHGPATLGTVEYGLKSLTYCADIGAPAYIDDVVVSATTGAPYTNLGAVSDFTDRTTTGCYTVTVNDTTGTSHMAAFDFSGGAGGSVTISSVTTTWAPKTSIQPLPLILGGGQPENIAG